MRVSQQSNPVIHVEHLQRRYVMGNSHIDALRSVDIDVHANEYLAIMGPSGSGKSTLMNLVGCLDTPSSGQYFCDGVDVATLHRLNDFARNARDESSAALIGAMKP